MWDGLVVKRLHHPPPTQTPLIAGLVPTLDQLLHECLPHSSSLWQWLANPDLDRHFREMKVRQVLRLLHDDGWYLVATTGSHRQFKHPTKSGRVTVAGKPSDDLAAGTLGSILKQAGLE
jgi:predicted RNA binding protein YcfA (HicA-like mRNA interferase family)